MCCFAFHFPFPVCGGWDNAVGGGRRWAYGIISAALLGLSDIAAAQLIERAKVGPAAGYRVRSCVVACSCGRVFVRVFACYNYSIFLFFYIEKALWCLCVFVVVFFACLPFAFFCV